MRQGLHQLAQKSTNTYLPLNEESEIGLPFTSDKVKSGAGLFKRLPPAATACCCAWLCCMELRILARPVCLGNLLAVLLITSVVCSGENGSKPKPAFEA